MTRAAAVGCGAEVDVSALVVAGGHRPVLLEPVYGPLNGVALLASLFVEARWSSVM